MRRVVLAALAVLSALPGCGYSLAGRGNFLPEYIATIAIPTFANRSNRVAVEEVFTRKVVEEFTARGRYKIQAEQAGADAELLKLLGERQNLEEAVERLKLRKAEMKEEDYLAELERLLVELAKLNEGIKAKQK